MAFRFRLASVLRYRAWCEDLQALALARAQASARILAARRGALAAAERQTRAALDQIVERGDGDALRRRAAELDALRRAGARAERLLGDAETRVAEARQALLAARRARRALEGLRDRQAATVRKELDRRQARALDEVAAAGWRRRSGRLEP
jgi:flagellar export protein FliJ